MSKHTPGPWKVCPMGVYIFGPAMEMVADMPERFVCRMRGVGGNLPIEDNANLIASAPDLLEALEGLTGDLNERMTDVNPVLFDRALEVIAKAKGEA